MTIEQFLGILRARKILALSIFFTVIVFTLVVSLLLPKQYTAEATIALDTKAADPITGMQGGLAPGYIATQIDIINSKNTALKVVDKLGLTNMPEAHAQFMEETGGAGDIRSWFAKSILGGLAVIPSQDSNVINLNYTAVDPQFAALLANSFVQAYIKTSAEIKIAAARQNNDFFQEQLKSLKTILEKEQQKMAAYQQEKGIVNSDERLDIETQRLNEISSQLVAAQSQMFDTKSRARGGQLAPDVLNNPLIQQLKNQLTQQESKAQELAEKTGPNHPHYKQAMSQVNSTKEQLNQLMGQYAAGLNSAADNSASRQAALNAALLAQKEKVLEIKSQRAALDVLQRNVDSAQRSYDQALQRLSQTMLESRADLTNISVLQEATPPLKHSKPRTLINLIISIVIGSVLALAITMIVEFTNRSVHSQHDLEQLIGVPVLADIHDVSLKNKSVFRFVKGDK